MVSQPYSFPAVFINFVVWGSQDSSVGIETGYRLDSWSSIPGRSKRFFSFHNIQTSSGVHPASYPMGTDGYLPRGKAARA
jgi:hypothetical protein